MSSSEVGFLVSQSDSRILKHTLMKIRGSLSSGHEKFLMPMVVKDCRMCDF